MEIIRATKTAEQAGAYYVRIQAMARKHKIPLIWLRRLSEKPSLVIGWKRNYDEKTLSLHI